MDDPTIVAPPSPPIQQTDVTAIATRTTERPDDQDDKDLLQLGHERFQLVCSNEADWRRDAKKEMDFVFLNQHWSDAMLQERRGRPCLTFNLIGPAIDNVINDARQDPPEPRISPVGNGADKDTAEILQGLLRNIDNDSHSDIAFLTGYEHAVSVGRGSWRVTYEYENDNDFQQKILIKSIPNLFSVYPDPATSEFGYTDMRYCFVTEDIDESTFKDLYPHAKAASGDFSGVGDKIQNEWFPKGAVRVAEYWWVDTEDTHICQLQDGSIVPWNEVPDGEIPVNTRKVEKRTVHGAKLSGNEILEKWDHPGRWIPIICCIGREIIRSNRRETKGMIRDAMDANLSYDYTRSKQVEAVSLTPLAPWLVADESIEEYEESYANANRKSTNVLKYKARSEDGKDLPPPRRVTVDPDIAALTTCVQYAKQDCDSQLSTYPSMIGAPSPESSGRAILARERQGDNAHFNYHDNLARAIRQTARIIIDLVPHVYSEQRVISIFDPDGSARTVPINQVHIFQGTQRIYDLQSKVTRYDVIIGSGPSYASRRQQGVDAFLQLVQHAPEVMGRALDLGVRMMDIPNADKIADRLRPPDVAADADDQAPMPPQAQKAIQQLTQMNQQLIQAVHKLSEKIETKVLDLESKERIALIQEKGGIIQAEIKAASADAGKLADIEMAHAASRLDALHEGTSLDQEAASMEQQQQQFQDNLDHQKQMQTAQLAAQKAQQQNQGGNGGGNQGSPGA